MTLTHANANRQASNRGPLRKLPNQKVAVLIDDDNLSITAQQEFGRRVDYVKLLDAINDREIVRTILYRPATPSADRPPFPPGLQRFLERRLGMQIKTPPKNVDGWLIVDAIRMASKVDVIALVGGDGDYEPLADHLKALGCKVEVWSWPQCTSRRLQEAADHYIPLGEEFLRTEPEQAAAA
jgi:uncharacterized LabA/DUF88 family protein